MSKRLFTAASTVLVLMFVSACVTAPQEAGPKVHKIVFHVDDNSKQRMNITLNNAANVTKYYQEKGEEIEIEIVAYGPGLHMLRSDTSPVKKRLASYAGSFPNITFSACGNTIKGMTRKEGKKPPIMAFAKHVMSGVVQINELQEAGWSYVRP